MQLNLSEAVIKAIDRNGPALSPAECPVGRECPAISGSVRFMARAYAESAGGDFFRTEGVAFIHGYEGHWTIEAATLPSAQVPLWENDQFDIDADADDDLSGRHAEAFLAEPVRVDVDLSSLAVGELFATGITVDTQAIDTRGGDSGVEAFVRNPEAVTPLVVAAGVRARGEPDFPAPPVTPPAPAVCPLGPDPDAGTLQFSRPDYVTAEAGNPFVLVTRTGGTNGAVSASVITSDGSAEAGTDYTALSTTVRFEDGDSSPRLVEIPILQDGVLEPDETFDVSLLDPNCVALGIRARQRSRSPASQSSPSRRPTRSAAPSPGSRAPASCSRRPGRTTSRSTRTDRSRSRRPRRTDASTTSRSAPSQRIPISGARWRTPRARSRARTLPTSSSSAVRRRRCPAWTRASTATGERRLSSRATTSRGLPSSPTA